MKFSFIHMADIHLGRPFSDLSENGGKLELCNQACKNSFNKIINFAISKNVDFVLIAGDSFDNDEHDLSSKLQFREYLKKLADNNIKSYVICGNHDSIEFYRKYNSYFKFDLKYNDLIHITGVTTESHAETYSPLEGVNIHTVSFRTDEEENQIKFLPTVELKSGKEFHIGLLHCDLDKNESKYSPVSREGLRNLGYDYYALGHIHIPEIKEDSVNKIVYAGTPQGRTKKETGAHGCYYVEVEDNNISNIEMVPADYVRFLSMDIDCSEFENKLEVLEEIVNRLNNLPTDTELSLYEINLVGETRVYKELDDNILEDFIINFENAIDKKVGVYKINNSTIPFVDNEELKNATGVVGILAEIVSDENEIKLEDIYDNISETHENIYKKLGLDFDSKELLSFSLELDKKEIIDNAKKEIKALCSEIYNVE